MDEVELDVAAATDLLPLLLLLSEGHVLAALDDGQVGRQEALEAVLDEGEGVLGVGLARVQVVEEDAPDAPRLPAVLVVEVLVAPPLEPRVVGLVVLVAGLLQGAVEVHGVLVEQVARGQVAAAAEPPGLRGAVGAHGLEVAVVEVHGGRHGVARVQDQAQAQGVEVQLLLGGDGAVVRPHLVDGALGQRPVHDADVHPGLLEHVALLQHARQPPAAVRPRPRVVLETHAVDLL